MVGGTVSTMLILKEHVEVNPELSLAVQVAVVVPRGKLYGAKAETVGEHAIDAIPAPSLAKILPL